VGDNQPGVGRALGFGWAERGEVIARRRYKVSGGVGNGRLDIKGELAKPGRLVPIKNVVFPREKARKSRKALKSRMWFHGTISIVQVEYTKSSNNEVNNKPQSSKQTTVCTNLENLADARTQLARVLADHGSLTSSLLIGRQVALGILLQSGSGRGVWGSYLWFMAIA